MDIEQTKAHLKHVDGVMMGRAAYQTPWVLASVDEQIFAEPPSGLTRVGAVEAFIPYIAQELSRGTPLTSMTKHILGLFNGLPGARMFRRHISENAFNSGATEDIVLTALDYVRDSELECEVA